MVVWEVPPFARAGGAAAATGRAPKVVAVQAVKEAAKPAPKEGPKQTIAVLFDNLPKLTVRSFFRAGVAASVAVHPTGRLLATRGRRLELWSLATHRPVAAYPLPDRRGKVEFSADGRYLLAVTDAEVKAAWPVGETPERRTLRGHPSGVRSLAFSPDGRTLASVAKDRTLSLWDVDSGRPRDARSGYPYPLEDVAFSPDGAWVVTADVAGAVHLWDPATGKAVAWTKPTMMAGAPPGQIWRVQFSPAGDFVAACGEGGAAGWTVAREGDKVELRPLFILRPPEANASYYDLAVRPGGTLVLLDKVNRLWTYDVARGGPPEKLNVAAGRQLRCLAFDGGGSLFTFVSRDQTLGVWDWDKKRARVTDQKVFQQALDPSGRWVATSTANQGVVIYDPEAGREVLTFPPEGADVWCLAWAPNVARLAVGLSDGGLAVWELEAVSARLGEFGVQEPRVTRRGAVPHAVSQ